MTLTSETRAPEGVGADPYLIEGPARIRFSGGRTSGYMLKHILDAHGGTLLTSCASICTSAPGSSSPSPRRSGTARGSRPRPSPASERQNEGGAV